jgi:alpha-mannosidase
VRRAAYSLTRPLLWRRENAHAGRLPLQFSAASVSDPSVIVETIKWAEDEDALIARLYEADGGAGSATLHVGVDAHAVDEVDLLERNPRPLSYSGRSVDLDLRAREVKTVRIAATF